MKRLLVVIVLGLALMGFLLTINSKKPNQGTVLGAAVNNFYLEKTVRLYQYPVKNPMAADPKILAGSAILIDAKTKYPLFQKESEKPVPIASITKVMTAIITLENFKLDDVVTVTKDQTNVIGSKVFLKPDEKITVENLLYCLLLNSGNDAAKALSSANMKPEDFIALMNVKAEELGLSNTKFMDPAGLNDQGHSSARDLAILFSYALSNEHFRTIVSTPEKKVTSVDGSEIHELKNSNRLTTGEIKLDGIIGGKTGFTPDAGHTLVSSAERDGNQIVGVILNTYASTPQASAEEMKKLLTWGFDSYTFVK